MDIKKFEQYEKAAEAGRVLAWLKAQGILQVGDGDVEIIAMEYAGLLTTTPQQPEVTDPMEGHYYLIADDKEDITSKSLDLVKREFKEFIESGEYSSVKIQSHSGEVVEEWVDEKVEKILNRVFILRIKTHENTLEEKSFKFYNQALTEYSEAIAPPYEYSVVWIEDNYGVVMITWEIENSRPDGRRESAQFTFDLCKEINALHLWKGKSDASLVRQILINHFSDYPNKEGNPPNAQEKWMREVHLEAKGKDFWNRARGLYEAHKKATERSTSVAL